jgi:hypothetical protein
MRVASFSATTLHSDSGMDNRAQGREWMLLRKEQPALLAANRRRFARRSEKIVVVAEKWNYFYL